MMKMKSCMAWLIVVTMVLVMATIAGSALAEYSFVQQEAETFSTANGVAWDSAVSALNSGSTYTASWAGKSYQFTVGTSVFATFAAAYAKAVTLNASNPTVLALPGSHGNVAITGAVTLLGYFHSVDPNVRGADETAVPALNPQRRSDLESKIGSITVAAGVTGQVTVSGFVMTGGFQDTARAVSGTATHITLKNLIVRQESGAFTNFLINTNNPNNINSAASGQNNCDSFEVKNCRVETLVANRLASNMIAPVYTIDGLVTVDNTPFWGYPQWRRYFTNAQFTMRNCSFHGIEPTLNESMNCFIHMEGLNKFDGACTMQFENNVFQMKNTGSGYCLGVYPRRNYTIRIVDNTFISAVGPKEPICYLMNVNASDSPAIGSDVDLIGSGNLTLAITGNRFVKFTKFSYPAYQINAATTLDITDNFFTNDGVNYKTVTGIAPQTTGEGASASVCHSYYKNWWCTNRSAPDYGYDDHALHGDTAALRDYDSFNNLSTYTVSSPADWNKLKTLVNGGTQNFYGKTVKLVCDLNLGGATIDPVGGIYDAANTNPANNNSFRGTFDGGGHEISNFVISKSDKYGVGLFGALKNAQVKNLAVANATITGNDKVGGLAGYADATVITNCSVDVNVVAVSGANGSGQLVSQARSNARINNCITRGTVTGSSGRVCAMLAWGQNTAITKNSVSYTAFGGYKKYYHFGRYSGNYGESDGRVVNCYVNSLYEYDYCETYAGDANAYSAVELAQRCGLAVAGDTLVIQGRGRAGARAAVTNGSSTYDVLGYAGDPAVPRVPGYYVYLTEDTHLNGTDAAWAGTFRLLELPLILHTNGGTLTESTPEYFTTTAETELPDISKVLRNGRLFAGWYDNPSFTGKRWDKIPAGLGEQVELYAKFVEITRSIGTPEELNALAAEVNGGDTKLDQGILITADFSTAGYGFPGIANSILTPFEGVLYGNEHTITIHCTGHALSGLVGALGARGTVAGVNVRGTVAGYTAAGGAVAYNMGGVVSNCTFSGNISVEASAIKIVSQNLLVNTKVTERATALWNLVTSVNPDVIGMQEAGESWINALNSRLGSTYAMVYCYRGAGTNPSGNKEATPVLYNKTKYNLLNSGSFWLSETPDTCSSCFDDGYSYNRIVSWVKLQNKTTKEVFCFFSTHFSLDDYARLRSEGVLRQKVREICGEYIPFFIVADYNMSRASVPYALMSEWSADLAQCAVSTEDLDHMTFNGFNFGTNQPGNGAIIDFCFADPRFVTSNSYEVLDAHTYLNQYPVSDHYGLYFNAELGHPTAGVVGINFGLVRSCSTPSLPVVGLNYGN